jgi:hypothetical protein
MGVESERLLGRDPESMGEPDEERAYMPRWSRRFRRRLPPWFNWKIGLLAVVLLGITIGFLTSGYQAVKGDTVSMSQYGPVRSIFTNQHFKGEEDQTST